MLLLSSLSAGNKIGLAIVAVIFIGFALTSSFVASKKWPDYPGKNGMSVFIIVCVALFAAMLTAVVVFDREPEAKGAEAAPPPAAVPSKTIPVVESEFKIQLAQTSIPAGTVAFAVKNAGKIQHDLAISGGSVSGTPKTPLISPGGTAKLTVTLKAGTYTLYCTVPGHRAAGMVAQLAVH